MEQPLGAQHILDRVTELLDCEWLEQSCGEHDTELGKAGWRCFDAGADQRKRWIDYPRGLGQRNASRRRGLNHQQVNALQLLGYRYTREDWLVTDADHHALQQPSDVIVGLADQYSCHVSMIDQAREIPGCSTV